MHAQSRVMLADNPTSEFYFADAFTAGVQLYPGEQGSLILLPDGLQNLQAGIVTMAENSQQSVSTPEQIRLWRQREVNRMFHGGEKELVTQGDLSITHRSEMSASLVLPSRPYNRSGDDWFTILLFIAMALFVSVKYMFGPYTLNLFQSLFSYSTASRMYRERNVSLNQGEIRLEIFSYCIFGLFLYQLSSYFNLVLPLKGFLNFLITMSAVMAFLMVKKLLYLAVGFVVENSSETGEFLYNFNNHIRVMGILSLPVVAIIAWAPLTSPYPLFVIGLTIMSILYLILISRGARIFLKKQFSIFYLFLYLCTLEILPLLLMYKWITG